MTDVNVWKCHYKPSEDFCRAVLVAAHRTAPFGTYALVTNLANGRTVQVRINDRGPAVAGRVVDLSYAAARQLDMVRVGVTRVKIELLAAPLPDHPRSQEDFQMPSEPLIYEAQYPPALPLLVAGGAGDG